jgi:hypothetical protein
VSIWAVFVLAHAFIAGYDMRGQCKMRHEAGSARNYPRCFEATGYISMLPFHINVVVFISAVENVCEGNIHNQRLKGNMRTGLTISPNFSSIVTHVKIQFKRNKSLGWVYCLVGGIKST